MVWLAMGLPQQRLRQDGAAVAVMQATNAAARLRSEAYALLQRNNTGDWTLAAPDLYPHQWSWDAGFIAIGWAHIDVERAIRELRSLLAAQWSNGKIPHIVFNPDAPASSYWPGPQHWACKVPDHAPTGCIPGTSGLCQPPVHAIAAARLWKIADRAGGDAADRARSFLADVFPRLMAWHAYLLTERDPEGSGLVSIYHPWESGMDNAPRWDTPLAAITTEPAIRVDRPDLRALVDTTQRPLNLAYDRFHLLVARLRDVCYDDAVVHIEHPFMVKDVFASGLLVAANTALVEIAGVIGAPERDRDRIQTWLERGTHGVRQARDPASGLSRDYDVRTGHWLASQTIAGFAELIAGRVPQPQLRTLTRRLLSTGFAGHPWLRWPAPPSTSPHDPAFDRRRYWRGPSWPVMTWLLWWALHRAGQHAAATSLHAAALDQIWCSGGFPEYVEPFSGEALGSLRQSWTAAVTIDWLADAAPWSPAATQARFDGPCERPVYAAAGDLVESSG
jgi:hypothetical protein